MLKICFMVGKNLAAPRVQFPIDDVKPSAERLPEIAALQALERTVRDRILTCSQPHQNVVSDADFHPLIAAAALAYRSHYPLVLTPDVLWLTILQGVAQHISNHAEALRSRLVQHQTKIELFVDTALDALPQDSPQMLAVAKEFVALIAKHVQPDKRFLLEAHFSTTGEIERIVECIVLMDAFQPYFDYVFAIICGIPSVILEGSPEDWELLRNKVSALHESDLDLNWWTTQLLPLCDQFIRASRGDVDSKHWKDVCKLKEKYGADDLNGWLLKFIPYVRKEKNERPIHQNPVLKLTDFSVEAQGITGCTSNMLPTGISGAPVTCINKANGKREHYQFVGGLAGVAQSEKDLSLRPIPGWAITEGHLIDRLIERLRIEHNFEKTQGLCTRDIAEKFNGYLPGDLWRFYTEFDSGSIKLRKPNRWGETSIYIYSPNSVRTLWEPENVNQELGFLLNQALIGNATYEERKRFNSDYGNLVIFGQGSARVGSSLYVFGHDPELRRSSDHRDSRGEIFRWTRIRTADAFMPVAHTFTEWLAQLLDS
jgi:hypothetical protein